MTDPERVTGTFYVKFAADESVTLHEIETARVLTLAENPGFAVHDIVEASLVAQQPMGVSYLVDELQDRYAVPVTESPEPPTRQIRVAAEDLEPTAATVVEREGRGEIHALRVPPDEIEATVSDLREDETVYKTVARADLERVEIRTDDSGLVSVRYLP